MCRNIKTLFNFAAFNRAVIQVAAVARTLIDTLETDSAPRERAAERFKAT